MAYSSIPTLSDVLYYTPTDSYDYMTDNRPIYQLDSNITALASSLIGIGYGEHTSIMGGLLAPGKVVELLPYNGQIKYPDTSTDATKAILGFVIGNTSSGLTKVVWSSQLLDLRALGLDNIVSGAAANTYIKATSDSTGNIALVTSLSPTDLVLGRVRAYPYITIDRNSQGSSTAAFDITSQANHFNLYGVSRFRNLLLSIAAGSVPVQFTKETVYQESAGVSNSLINLMNLSLDYSNGQVLSGGVITQPIYGVDAKNWVIKEKYYRFQTGEASPKDAVTDVDFNESQWPTTSYQSSLTSDALINYDLQSVNSSLDFSTPVNLEIFKSFDVQKYYQYAKVASDSPLYGKKTVIVTVFDPHSTQMGGETSRILICDFISYNTSGLETFTHRVVLTGTIASTIYDNTSIFPSLIKDTL